MPDHLGNHDQREATRAYIAYLQHVLMLKHYRIFIAPKKSNSDCFAQVDIELEKNAVTLSLCKTWHELPDYIREEFLLHELLHIVQAPSSVWLKSKDRAEQADEVVTDHLTQIIRRTLLPYGSNDTYCYDSSQVFYPSEHGSLYV